MTPLGHAGISLLIAGGITKLAPNLSSTDILLSTAVGGTILDLDLVYRACQKGPKVFDKTIGQHRFFPTHTPFFVIILGVLTSLINITWGIFFTLGMLIHLLLDTLFFPEGINFSYPFNRKMTTFLTIKTHPFWAPKPISSVDGWLKNYLSSPLFWVSEVLPTIIALMLIWQL